MVNFCLQLGGLDRVCFLPREYDPELDDIRSILADLCRSAGPETVFTVSGFGQECWPVDVEVDLLVCMEQLPRLIKMLSQGLRHELDFYEQGLERLLSFNFHCSE